MPNFQLSCYGFPFYTLPIILTMQIHTNPLELQTEGVEILLVRNK